ncbi:S8 family serine peptidase [Nocardioides sp. YIM 152588]|uniref:S8 family serine peptidase n=1 Tax=Nocardioides sp. YIM 152588 TaxID=3158259 RepID=UPI0032E4C66E
MLATGALVVPTVLVGGALSATGAPDHQPDVERIVLLDPAKAAVHAAPGRARKAALAEVRADQGALEAAADGAGIDLAVSDRFEYVVNAVSVSVPADQLADLAALPGVTGVVEPVVYAAPEPVAETAAEILEKALEAATRTRKGRGDVTVTDLTGVPEAHRAGFSGAGVEIGIIDSGLAYDHPAFAGRYLGGYDFAMGDDDPYDDVIGSAAGHGTHVAGIALGDDEHMTGVAPEARVRAYRVFGSGGGANDDVILAALDRAAADGVDVVNMSLGDPKQRSTSPVALAVNQLSDSGVPVVVSNGNGFAGPFSGSAPGVAEKAIAVGSVYSDSMPWLAFSLNDGSEETIPFEIGNRNANAPSSGSAEVVEVTTGCEPLEAGSLDGKVALFALRYGDYTCRAMDQARTVRAAGAVAGLHYNPRTSEDLFTTSVCCGAAIDMPIALIRGRDADRILEADSPVITWGAYYSESRDESLTGMTSFGSAWGPGSEMEFKPDVSAPGEYIFSTVTPAQGYYGQKAGTSMAAPHVAGIVALMLQADPTLTPEEIREVLANTATPMGFTGDPDRGLQPTAQQGAGRVNAVRALAVVTGAAPTASPSRLAFGDLEGRQAVQRIEVGNDGDEAVTYAVTHEATVSAEPPYTHYWVPNDAASSVSFSRETITVRAGASQSLTVKVREPGSVPEGTLLGGWVVLTPTTPGHGTIRVPYQALAGDRDAVSAINPTLTAINTKMDNPSLRPSYSFNKSVPVTLDYSDALTTNNTAYLLVSHGFPLLERYRMQVVDSRGNVVATPLDEAWTFRISGAGTGYQMLTWAGKDDDGDPVAAGTYRLRLVFEKALGDADGAPATETWSSPDITVVR